MKKLIQNFRNFRAYSFEDKLLIVKAFFITGIMKIILIVVPFRILKNNLGKYNEESSFYIDEADSLIGKKISWVVSNISKHTPWECKCFVQALTAQKLLYDMKIESTLYLGVSKSLNKDILDAHAWIRCGNIYVTGGNGEKFSVIVKFKK